MKNNIEPATAETGEPKVVEVGIRICADCLRLKGEMCNNAECVFCRRTMAEVGHYLDVLLDCDSNLSAYGHGRPLTKAEALELSQRARALYEKLRIDK